MKVKNLGLICWLKKGHSWFSKMPFTPLPVSELAPKVDIVACLSQGKCLAFETSNIESMSVVWYADFIMCCAMA